MNTELPQPACITIRYGKKRYLLCADEVTNFLINAEKLGFHSLEDITTALRSVVAQLPAGQERPAALLEEICESMQACLFADS